MGLRSRPSQPSHPGLLTAIRQIRTYLMSDQWKSTEPRGKIWSLDIYNVNTCVISSSLAVPQKLLSWGDVHYNSFLWHCTNWGMMNNTTPTSLLSTWLGCDAFISPGKSRKHGRFVQSGLLECPWATDWMCDSFCIADLCRWPRSDWKDDFLLQKSVSIGTLSAIHRELCKCEYLPPKWTSILEESLFCMYCTWMESKNQSSLSLMHSSCVWMYMCVVSEGDAQHQARYEVFESFQMGLMVSCRLHTALKRKVSHHLFPNRHFKTTE